MKTQLYIITGFLGSGKTTYINGLLDNLDLSDEKVVIIQCEQGESEIDNAFECNSNVHIIKWERTKKSVLKLIEDILKKYRPHSIIIEHNGTESTEKLLEDLQKPVIQKNCVIHNIVHTIDAQTFEVFIDNMGAILTEQIASSDLIVVNNSSDFTKSRLKAVEKLLKTVNPTAKIARTAGDTGPGAQEGNEGLYIEKQTKQLKLSDVAFFTFCLLVLCYLSVSVLKAANFELININLSRFQALNTIFISILIQAFPFILFGVIVSSVIQVFISNETIVKLFPEKMGLGFVAAIFAGLLFPVCDCAVVPVAARLEKKGVPVPTVVAFMLAAPLMSPLSIASTFYAFPGQPSVAIYRVILGIIISVIVGLTFWIFPEEKQITLNRLAAVNCKCGYCNTGASKKPASKIEAVFKHAGSEFFEVGRFIIVGAFLSSLVQTFLPKDILLKIGGGAAASIIIMLLSAFVLSVCSTSDAFIARTFVNQFPMASVMGFMVLGPMIDIKNVLMLLGNFKKRFVAKLVFLIFSFTFIILSFFSIVFFGL